MWHPINTIPKDGKEYVVCTSIVNNVRTSSIYYVNNRDARDEPPYWMDEHLGFLEDLSVYTHWTELPKD